MWERRTMSLIDTPVLWIPFDIILDTSIAMTLHTISII
jgi:hypothetical protein